MGRTLNLNLFLTILLLLVLLIIGVPFSTRVSTLSFNSTAREHIYVNQGEWKTGLSSPFWGLSGFIPGKYLNS